MCINARQAKIRTGHGPFTLIVVNAGGVRSELAKDLVNDMRTALNDIEFHDVIRDTNADVVVEVKT